MKKITTRNSLNNFDETSCIICQKRKNLQSNETGIKKIRIAAYERQDLVFDRLNILSKNEKFYYHSSKSTCFQTYVNREVCEPEKNEEAKEDVLNDGNNYSTFLQPMK